MVILVHNVSEKLLFFEGRRYSKCNRLELESFTKSALQKLLVSIHTFPW